MKQFLVGSLLCFLLAPFAYAGEDSKYNFSWLDADKEVYVLQNRTFRKDGKFTFSLLGGITTSGAFSEGQVASARFSYFFKEEWGIEGVYSQNFSSENSTAEALQAGLSIVPFIRKPVNYYGAMLLWSPFYAKLNAFNGIFYFDWIFGLGLASITDENNKNTFGTSNTTEWTQETNTGIMWETGLRFYITPSWSLRLNMTTIHYQAERAVYRNEEGPKKWFSNYDLLLGVNYSL